MGKFLGIILWCEVQATLALRRAAKLLETFVNDYSNMGIMMMALRCIY